MTADGGEGAENADAGECRAGKESGRRADPLPKTARDQAGEKDRDTRYQMEDAEGRAARVRRVTRRRQAW